MEKTWMPTVAGILDIISGFLGLMGGLVLIILGTVASGILGPFMFGRMELVPLGYLLVLGIPLLVLGILALLGGVYAIQRKVWGLALAGSISAFIFSQLLGILAIIFTALSKKEFE